MTLLIALAVVAAIAAGSTGRLAYEHHALRAAQIVTVRAVRRAGAATGIPLLAPHGGHHLHRRTA